MGKNELCRGLKIAFSRPVGKLKDDYRNLIHNGGKGND